MVSPVPLALIATTIVPVEGSGAFVPAAGVRASAQAVVRLLDAASVPMSAQSQLEAPQRRTTIRLADGDHEAFIVEFE